MSRQYWSEGLTWSTSDGTAVASTAAETIAVPNVTIPANYMQDGRTICITAYGKLSTTGTPTMIFALRWGGVAGTLLATTEAITTASGSANTMWSVKIYVTTRTNGATGSLFATGNATVNLTSSTNTSQAFGVSGFDAPAAVTVDLTADTALSFTATWSASSASNTLTTNQYYIESIN
jgi:hypothetical protein